MGTNYYAVKTCECCGNEDKYHIGKSSGGWVFSLHVEPDEGINDLYDVMQIIKDPKRKVVNEYGDTILKKNLLDIIKNRKGEERGEPPNSFSSWGQFHRINDSLEGPNNLLRHKLKHNCIAHERVHGIV